MTEQRRDRDLGSDAAATPDPADEVETGVGREPWIDRSGEGHDGDMGETGKTDVTSPDPNSGESQQPG